MAANLQQRLENITSKAKLLTWRYQHLVQEHRSAEKRIADLEAIIEQQQQQAKLMALKIESLQVVSSIAPSRDETEKTRRILSELLRDIDKCINELTE